MGYKRASTGVGLPDEGVGHGNVEMTGGPEGLGAVIRSATSFSAVSRMHLEGFPGKEKLHRSIL